MSFLHRTVEWKFAAVLGAALAISACAKNPAENGAALAGLNGGPAAPGSPQDFAVNVGDRSVLRERFQRLESDLASDPRQAG